MEASEKPQLSLDSASDGTVRVLEDRLVVEGLTITDDRAARVVRERAEIGQPPADTVTKAVEIGARVLDSEETAVNVDYVRAEFERHAGTLRRDLSKTLEAGDVQLAERIAASFDSGRDGSVPKEIEDRVKEALAEQREALLKLFSAEEGANPLFDFKDAMVRVYRELGSRQQSEGEENRKRIDELTKQIIQLRERDEADRRVAEEAERGTAKGFSFEERAHEAVERIASLRGDVASHTGGEVAEGGGKKGDTLVELGAASGPACGRIVFEAKDKKLSKNDAWRELNDSMAARAASFAVLVVAGEDRVPSGRESLVEYEGNKMIVAVDRDLPGGLALEVAYRLAAARVAMARDTDLQVDPIAVRDTAEEAKSILKQAQAIYSTLTGIKTSSERASEGVRSLVEAVRGRLERIETLVAEAGDE